MRPDGGHDALEILPPPTPTRGTPFRDIEILGAASIKAPRDTEGV